MFIFVHLETGCVVVDNRAKYAGGILSRWGSQTVDLAQIPDGIVPLQAKVDYSLCHTNV